MAIKPNAAKRGLAKLCLNSMLGKLTERKDRTRTKIIKEPHELYRFLATPGVELTNLSIASDDVVWLSWKVNAEENVPNKPPHKRGNGSLRYCSSKNSSVWLSRPSTRKSDLL